MIQIDSITKNFDDIRAVDNVSLTLKEGNVFGLIGTNGAGKSTVLRMMSGVIRPDKGSITVDEERIYDNPTAKQKIFFIADEPYFFTNATPKDMACYYKSVYTSFNMDKFNKLLAGFELVSTRKISTFSKGMKKQLAIILGLCSGAKYLFCDETFDGLDPVMRQGIKAIMAKAMEEGDLTPVIASHNLRELEDICDHVGLLHKGGVLLSKELADMKLNIQKVQCVLDSGIDADKAFSSLDIIKKEQRGSLFTLTLRASHDDAVNYFSCINTVFFEALPLSLEEIFISETEVAGYDIKKIISG